MKSCFSVLCALVLLLMAGSSVAFADDSWIEVKSPHFSVITDGGEKRGREVALRFEQERAVFGAMISAKVVNVPIPVQIIAFKNGKEMRQVEPLFNGKPTEVAGLFQGGNDENFIALDLSSEDHWRTVFHEYAHLLLNSNFPRGPVWFDEGFAEYYSTIEVDGKFARIGMAPEGHWEYLLRNRFHTEDLLAVQQGTKTYNENGTARQTFYAQSWLTVHYIFEKKLVPQAIRYFDLTLTQKRPIGEAFQKAFGMTTKEFDRALDNYLAGNRVMYGKLPAPEIETKGYTVAPLSVVDAQVALADMHYHSPDYHEKAVTEYETVLKTQPDNVRANRGLGYAKLMHGEIEQAESYLAKAAVADQQDAMVHYYYAMVLTRRSGYDDDVRAKIIEQTTAATKLNPELADAYNLMAIMYAHEHQFDAAEDALSKALKLKPQDENYLANLAGFYMQQDKLEQAKPLLARLVGSSNPSVAMMASRSLESMENESKAEQALLVRAVEAAAVESKDEEPQQSAASRQPVQVAERPREPAAAAPPEEESVVPPPVKEVPVAYVRGTLTEADCGSSAATITVVTDRKKTLKLASQNWKKMIVFGADQFSCTWKNKKVSVNYRPQSGSEAEGIIVALSLLE